LEKQTWEESLLTVLLVVLFCLVFVIGPAWIEYQTAPEPALTGIQFKEAMREVLYNPVSSVEKYLGFSEPTNGKQLEVIATSSLGGQP